MTSPIRTRSPDTVTLARSAGAAMRSLRVCAKAAAGEAASKARARQSVRAVMVITPQRNMAVVDCSIWSAALTTLAFIS